MSTTQGMNIPVVFDVRSCTMMGLTKNEVIYSGNATIFGMRVADCPEYAGCKSEAQAIKYMKAEIKQ